jgi:carboxylesterase type B
MHEPARFVARQVTAAGQPAWLYRFGYVAESQHPKGTAEHAKELPYLFGTLEVPYGAAVTPMGYIAAFAKPATRTAAACRGGRAMTPRSPS